MIIGITTTFVVEEQPGERVSVERVTSEYVRRVAATGATVVLVPPVEGGTAANKRAALELVERLDGLVLAGGGDIAPAQYGEAALPETTHVSEARDVLELALARLAHERDLPVLGICRGMQVMNIALGGTLYQDANACGLTAAGHQQKPPYDVARQRVDVAAGSLLHEVLCGGAGEGMSPGCKQGWPAALEVGRNREEGADAAEGVEADAVKGTGADAAEDAGACSLMVNSMHHQAIARLAEPLLVSAVSDDGLVEGVEDPSRTFYLGVQWHPEYLDDHAPLFEALACAVTR